MPTKKKTTSGPKATLMKKNLAQLKAQAKKLKIKGFSTKKKEALVNSIMMAQARKKKSSAPKKSMAAGKRMMKKRGAKPNRVMRRPVRPMAQKHRPTMSEYNGWKNYETWYVNLHYGDYFQEIYDEYSLEGDYDFIFYSDFYKDAVEDLLLEDNEYGYMNDVQRGIVSAFLSEVDFDEIAKHYIE